MCLNEEGLKEGVRCSLMKKGLVVDKRLQLGEEFVQKCVWMKRGSKGSHGGGGKVIFEKPRRGGSGWHH